MVSARKGFISPLDKVVDKIAAAKERTEAAKAKAARLNPKTKVTNAKENLKAKVAEKNPVNCRNLGHKGKRGKPCERCGMIRM